MPNLSVILHKRCPGWNQSNITFLVTILITFKILPVSGNALIESTHLILILSLDEEGQSKAHLGQLCDLEAVFRTVEFWSVVILVN